MIPATIRVFSTNTIIKVTGWSRTVLWRRDLRGRLGVDVVRFVQQQRANEGLPALSEKEVKDLLAALVAVEDERTKATEPAAALQAAG